MIINSLYDYYERLINDETAGVSLPGFSNARVSYALVLSLEGDLVEIIDLRVERRNKLVSREMVVPEQVIRSSGISPNFLCDNCKYVLGLTENKKKDKKKRIKDCFESFVSYHKNLLTGLNDVGAAALIKFLEKWDVNEAAVHPKVNAYLEELTAGGNFIFKLKNDKGFLHERVAIKETWINFLEGKKAGTEGQCLVTGEVLSLARLHPNIKGVTGAQSSGASLVSFNLDAFTSYGKSQSYNSPVSEKVALGYTTVLNYLLRQEKHRIRIGDTTVVFWAERPDGLEEDLLSALFFPGDDIQEKKNDSSQQPVRDPQTVRLVKDIFTKIKTGKPISVEMTGIDPDVNFYILGLAPNASRLSVRFWYIDRYGKILNKISQHYRDISIVKRFENEPDFINTGRVLKETAPLGDTKRIPPLLGGVLMRSILTGMPYPQVLYNTLLSRIRADRNINYVRAAFIKGFLVRSYRFFNNGNEVNSLMALDENNKNTAYILGRLFALLEKAQEDANPKLNATIKDRYFGSASVNPGSVFPILLRLSQHHIAKAEYGRHNDRRIEEVVNCIDSFPAYLNLEEQGLFVLGYYHQRQALYKKNEKKEG